jgi:hypothetical protein
MRVALYLFAESEGQPAQVVLRVEFIGLLLGCGLAEEVQERFLVPVCRVGRPACPGGTPHGVHSLPHWMPMQGHFFVPVCRV